MNNGLKIVSLTANNVKRLRAVHITPDDSSLVLISGDNDQGKTSVLDSIEMALAGTRVQPPEPIHRGEKQAKIVCDLGEYVIERTITPGGSRLVVKGADGAEIRSPQALLDGFVSQLSFDPLAFSTMKAQEQDQVLRRLVGIDFTSLDAERKKAFDERTAVARDLKRVSAQLESCAPKWQDAPATEQSSADIARRLTEATRIAAENNTLRSGIADKERKLRELRGELAEINKQIDALLAKAETREALIKASTAELSLTKEAVSNLVDPDIESIRRELAAIDGTNRKVRENTARGNLENEVQATKIKVDQLSSQIEAIDERKKLALETAEYPIAGLGLSDSGVTLDGLPFSQASTSQKIRASIAIGAALNPRLKVLLVRDGDKLGQARLREVARMAEDLGLQVWVERIDPGELPAVVIEDGEVSP